MLLWVAMAALAAAVCLPLLMALRRPSGNGAERAAVDIYRDQLAELRRDVERGLIRADEAEAARAEIARRLLRADAASQAEVAAGDGRLRNAAAIAVVLMPLAAVAVYLGLGAPGLPDQPLAARLAAPPDSTDLAVQVARIDQHLARNPDDGRGWEVVAPVYIRMGRFDDAVTAYRHAIRVLGPTPEREVKLGLALVTANDRVTDEAIAAFRRATALAPADVTAHVYLATALADRGEVADAVGVWRELLANGPAEAPWRRDVEAEIARLEAGRGPSAPPGGPSAADIAAAADLPPDQRAAMIEGMVSSLAARLETNSGDAQGWAQLVRSYAVLGRPDDARAALNKAKAALAADKAKIAIVDEAARSAGIGP
jgi:cytochrome c-type biogenesis protein CcmH